MRAQVDCEIGVFLGILIPSFDASGKRLFVPRMADLKAGKLQMLRVYSVDDLNTLPSKLWGIREPGVLKNNGETPREDGVCQRSS